MDEKKTFLFKSQKDIEYGECLKFHHVFHSYSESHNHDFYEFIICFQGSYKHIVNGEERILQKLDSELLFPSDCHSLEEKDKDSSHYCISFEKHFFEKEISAFDPSFFERYKKGRRLFSLSEARLKKIVFLLAKIVEEKDKDSLLQTLVSLLLFNLFEPFFLQNETTSDNEKPSWLRELLIDINKPDNLWWGVDDVVDRTNYSKTHLSRLFRKYMGVSIGEYLQKIKLNNARDILINSEMPLYELCEIIGHTSQSHFSSTFKKIYGISPAKYRAKYKSKE